MRYALAIILIVGFSPSLLAVDAQTLFEQKVRAILEQSCVRCHSPENKKGGLDLSTRETALKGGQTGPAIIAGKSGSSLVYLMSAHEEEPFMPQKEPKLSAEALAALAAWIDGGAPYTASLAVPKTKIDPKEFWSFKPLQHHTPPSIKNNAVVRTPVDAFVLAELSEKKLNHSSEASRRVLIRRVYFDLLGVPPQPLEIDSFVADPAPDAYEKLVDKLLTDPRFGERWGRHWLDVARYADSDGYEADTDRPNAYHYRDFVIRAFNDDLPFDTFVKWSIAGDEFSPDDARAIAATGFLTAGPVVETKNGTPLEREKGRYDELDDMLSTTGTALLGLSIGCARCHDHKYDPVSQKEYYRMLAAFTTSQRGENFLATREAIAEFTARDAAWQKRLKAAQAELNDWLQNEKKPHEEDLRRLKIEKLTANEEEKALLRSNDDEKKKARQELAKKHEKALALKDEDFRSVFSDEQKKRWDAFAAVIRTIESEKPVAPPATLSLKDKQATPEKSFFLERGEPGHKAGEVQTGFLAVLNGAEPSIARENGIASTFQRRAMAEWLVDTDKGAGALLARVIVNRLWQYHFGEGLVRTASDFGSQGDRPTNPALLEWLASELVARGWKLKEIHRLILLSATYRQSSEFNVAAAAIDPDNRLLWRRRPVRLEAEALRDAILSASGALRLEMFGPAVKPALPDEAMAGRNKDDKVKRPKQDGPEQWRRTVYLWVKRSLPTPLLETFDAPNSGLSCGRRTQSTVAPQALALLNDPFVRKQAELFAARVQNEKLSAGNSVRRAFQIALGRDARAGEITAALAFTQADGANGFVNFCQVLLTLNEFVYID